jgi:hypothetical protein
MFVAFDKVQVVNPTKPPRRSDTNFELDPMWLISAKAREKTPKSMTTASSLQRQAGSVSMCSL